MKRSLEEALFSSDWKKGRVSNSFTHFPKLQPRLLVGPPEIAVLFKRCWGF